MHDKYPLQLRYQCFVRVYTTNHPRFLVHIPHTPRQKQITVYQAPVEPVLDKRASLRCAGFSITLEMNQEGLLQHKVIS